MSNTAERLRRLAENASMTIAMAMRQAADELDKLQAERKVAEADKKEAQQDRSDTFRKFKSIYEENKRLKAELNKYHVAELEDEPEDELGKP